MYDEKTSAGQYIAARLGIPDGLEVESIVAVGYPDSRLPGHPRKNLGYRKVHENRYGNAFD